MNREKISQLFPKAYRTAVLFVLMLFPLAVSSQTYSMYVGEYQFVAVPDPPYGHQLDGSSWECDGEGVSLSQTPRVGCTVYMAEYFDYAATLTCNVNTTYKDSRGHSHVGHFSYSYTIKCLPVYLTLSQSSLTLSPGDSKKLSYTLSKSGFESLANVEWVSSNSNVATVSSNGTVTAIAAGSATITARSKVGPDASCHVMVNRIPPTAISIQGARTMKAGESISLSVTFTPSNASADLTWTSSNSSVATVSQSGQVTAKNQGSTTITVKTDNGKTASAGITVKTVPTAINMKQQTTLEIGETEQLTYQFVPSGADATVSWSSNATSVATVSNTGLVTAKNTGTAAVTVKSANGVTATCNVTVIPIQPTSVSIQPSYQMTEGETIQLVPTLTPDKAVTTFNYTSSNTGIATVSSDGLVTAIQEGSATITVKTANNKVCTCRVTVFPCREASALSIMWNWHLEKESSLAISSILPMRGERFPGSPATLRP